MSVVPELVVVRQPVAEQRTSENERTEICLLTLGLGRTLFIENARLRN